MKQRGNGSGSCGMKGREHSGLKLSAAFLVSAVASTSAFVACQLSL